MCLYASTVWKYFHGKDFHYLPIMLFYVQCITYIWLFAETVTSLWERDCWWRKRNLWNGCYASATIRSWRHYVFGLSVCPSVCLYASVPNVCERGSLFYQLLGRFHQIFYFGALGDKYEFIGFWGQKVKSQRSKSWQNWIWPKSTGGFRGPIQRWPLKLFPCFFE